MYLNHFLWHKVLSFIYTGYVGTHDMIQLKEFVGGNIVGSGSNYVVVQKDSKRFFIELKDYSVLELKKSTTPYGSDF
jgi:hypothetical protein